MTIISLKLQGSPLLRIRYLLMIYWHFKLLIKSTVYVWCAKTISGKVTNVYENEVFTFLIGKQLKYLNHVWNEWRMNMNVCSSSTIIYFVVAMRKILIWITYIMWNKKLLELAKEFYDQRFIENFMHMINSIYISDWLRRMPNPSTL